jgi:hypothetical protein
MSPFIDSMVTPEQANSLQGHVSVCPPCQRQLQSYISVRNLLAAVEPPAPPEDMVLETRVLLSQARNTNHWEQFENRIAIIFKPIAVPAILGVSLTMLFFGVLLGSLASQATVMASDRVSEAPVYALYKPVRTTGPTMMRFAGSEKKDLQHEPVMIETQVSDDGKVLGYEIISGQATPEITRWVREMLSVAKFTPATAFGKPVVSKIILSFVAVRS